MVLESENCVCYHVVMDVVVLMGLQNRRKVERKDEFH